MHRGGAAVRCARAAQGAAAALAATVLALPETNRAAGGRAAAVGGRVI
jgi:hypothetical protein